MSGSAENINGVKKRVFSDRIQSMIMGIIAIVLPLAGVAANLIANSGWGPLTSISIYYHTDGRDIFVGSLFIVGSFLISYKGWYDERVAGKFWLGNQSLLSTIAGVSAFCVALFPTECRHICRCKEVACYISFVHGVASFVLFGILFVFSIYIFQYDEGCTTVARKRRNIMYKISSIGFVIAAILVIAHFLLKEQWSSFLFAAEATALLSFGWAWLVSAKYLPWLRDADSDL